MDNWKRELIDNPPPSASSYTEDEWKDIVLNELICDPRNVSNIGECNPFYGKKHSKETIKLMEKVTKEYYDKLSSEERKRIHGHPGESNPMYGRDRSKEKNPMYGKQHSEDSREKIRQKAIGRIPNDKARKAMSKSQSQRWTPEERKRRSEEYKTRGHKPPSPKGLLWWNNGMEVKRSKECPGPEWVRGRKIE